MRIGADYLGEGRCGFTVWGPGLKKMSVRITDAEGKPKATLPMKKTPEGYWKAEAEGVEPGDLYLYSLNNKTGRADPASHSQPAGVAGPSEIIDHGFGWEDSLWEGVAVPKMVIYEIHTGTFTPEGAFDAVTPRLEELKDLGVTAIELMPVAQFPGARNWGYDGVFPFAAQNTYGGPAGLKRLVNRCHGLGISVILDVVYNHLGPEGNYLHEFGPYFTGRYKTPWGQAVNFDGPESDEVRNFFMENALYWFERCHMDALRLDAVHAILDFSARTFLEELRDRVARFSGEKGRRFHLMAESDRNDAALLRSSELHGAGMNAGWCDDFHHSVHAVITGEEQGYYADFGSTDLLVKSINEGYAYSGQYSKYRKRRFGNSSKGIPASRFIVFSQNHDQVGNRMNGERLPALVDFEALKLAAATVLLSPYIPLIFMGEEYGEEAPFLYFTSHSDKALAEAAREGRAEEFRGFKWKGKPPDPQSPETFERSRISWAQRETGVKAALLEYYRALIQMRSAVPAFIGHDKHGTEAFTSFAPRVVFVRRWKNSSHAFVILNFNPEDAALKLPLPPGVWVKTLDSSDPAWAGPGPLLPQRVKAGDDEARIRGHGAAVFVKEGP
ncbi:MAG: malto-oligosyltrehalose trehalohydrolase [Deltaproteobacteria bacterium]|nr:malto-oligosyltrehalose trehalohydrolase [Deltaproteobacteria bacterium]